MTAAAKVSQPVDDRSRTALAGNGATKQTPPGDFTAHRTILLVEDKESLRSLGAWPVLARSRHESRGRTDSTRWKPKR